MEESETHTMQKWGSERPLGGDYSKDAANNNQLDAALTSGDENGPSQPHRHRKGEATPLNIRLMTHLFSYMYNCSFFPFWFISFFFFLFFLKGRNYVLVLCI